VPGSSFFQIPIYWVVPAFSCLFDEIVFFKLIFKLSLSLVKLLMLRAFSSGVRCSIFAPGGNVIVSCSSLFDFATVQDFRRESGLEMSVKKGIFFKRVARSSALALALIMFVMSLSASRLVSRCRFF